MLKVCVYEFMCIRAGSRRITGAWLSCHHVWLWVLSPSPEPLPWSLACETLEVLLRLPPSHLSPGLLRLKTPAACFLLGSGDRSSGGQLSTADTLQMEPYSCPLLIHLIYHRCDQVTPRKYFLIFLLSFKSSDCVIEKVILHSSHLHAKSSCIFLITRILNCTNVSQWEPRSTEQSLVSTTVL